MSRHKKRLPADPCDCHEYCPECHEQCLGGHAMSPTRHWCVFMHWWSTVEAA